MDKIIAQIEAVARVADVFYGSAVAQALASFLSESLFSRGELTAEQKAQVDANFADYAEREARRRG